MFQLDENFLKDLGLDALPDEQKQAFLQHIYEELELRVGTKLSEGLSEQQMQEFEAFVDQNEDKVQAWFDKNLPDFDQEADFQQLIKRVPPATPRIAVISEYGSLKWLEMNRPDYRQVVAAELDALKKEITSNRDNILSQAA
jgi:hypothetical protein